MLAGRVDARGRSARGWLSVWTALSAVSGVASGQTRPAEVLVLSGRPAPGMADGVTFERVAELWPADYWPLLTQNVGPGGDFGFSPFVSGTSQRQFYAYRDDVLTRITGAGDLIPGTPEGYRFSGLYGAPAWDGATMYFRASTYDTRLGHPDMWSWDGEQAQLRVEMRMPGLPPGGIDGVFVAPGGWVVFQVNGAYWSEHAGTFTRLLGPGDPAPGMPAGTTIQSLDLLRDYWLEVITSVDGNFLVHGMAGGVQAVWSLHLETTQAALVARRDEPLPGMIEGETITWLFGEMTRSGRIFLWAGVRQNGQTGSRLWHGFPGSLVPYYRAGQPAPGLALATLQSHRWARTFGEDGFFLLARIAGEGIPTDQRTCVWIDSGGGLRLVARANVPLPCLRAGERARFPDGMYEALSAGNASPTGRIAFPGRIAEPGTGDPVRDALFALDRVGRVRVALSAGQSVEIGEGQHRAIQTIGSFGIGDDGTLIAGVVLEAPDGEYMDAIVRVQVDCANAACDYADVAGNDCAVTLDDLAAVLANFGQAGPLLSGDADLNDRVDFADLEHVLTTFGLRCDQ